MNINMENLLKKYEEYAGLTGDGPLVAAILTLADVIKNLPR